MLLQDRDALPVKKNKTIITHISLLNKCEILLVKEWGEC